MRIAHLALAALIIPLAGCPLFAGPKDEDPTTDGADEAGTTSAAPVKPEAKAETGGPDSTSDTGTPSADSCVDEREALDACMATAAN